MRTASHRILVFALVYSCIALVFAAPDFQQERSSVQSGSHVLGPVSRLKVVNKVIAPDGFPRSLRCVNLACRSVLTFPQGLYSLEGRFQGR